ncbi:hypothetical protein ABIA33_002734 [Streptacidiphilus sp. MAP12-16]|uniref:hypothetical protein n=1 Tax=Streptacidiphilus sp. MAP12-16 TaxID=3156300 RepID=UPI0035184F61
MSVLLCLLIAPLGLVVILGMSWLEDHVLRPPTSPGEQVVQSQMLQRQGPQGQSGPGPVVKGTVELLRIVRPQQSPPPTAKGGDHAA